MKPMLLLLAAAALLVGGAPPRSPAAPLGAFQIWLSSKKQPLAFESGGVHVTVAALPCRTGAQATENCRYDGFNNQAEVTIAAPDLPPFRVSTDPAALYVRVAVVRLDRRATRPGVVIESQSGGSSGDMTAQVLSPDKRGFRIVPLARGDGGRWLQGAIADAPTDPSGDGRVDFVLQDGLFAYAFGCGACTPRPPLILTVMNGRSIDISRNAAVRAVFARDMVARRATCVSNRPYRNGACAAYVADAARIGRFDAAWATMLRHYDRAERAWPDGCRATLATGLCPEDRRIHYASYPEALAAFLKRTGYLPATARPPLR